MPGTCGCTCRGLLSVPAWSAYVPINRLGSTWVSHTTEHGVLISHAFSSGVALLQVESGALPGG